MNNKFRMRRTSWRIGGLVGLLVWALLLATGQAPAQAASSDTELVVGAILPFHGAEADIGREVRQAIELALEDLDANIRVVFADSESDAAVAVRQYDALAADESPQVVMTVASWVSNAVYPLAANDGRLHIVMGSAVLDRTGPDFAVRTTGDVAAEAEYLARFLAQFDRIALVHMTADFGVRWVNLLQERLGSRVIGTYGFDLDWTDYRAVLADVTAADPDVMVILSGAQGVEIIRQAREAGIRTLAVGTRPIERPELVLYDYADGLIYSATPMDFDHPFVARFEERYGAPLTVFGAEGYDALTMLKEAYVACGADVECIYDWFIGREHVGAMGAIRIDDGGDARYDFTLKQVRDGKIVPYQED